MTDAANTTPGLPTIDVEQWFDLSTEEGMTWKHRARLAGVTYNAEAYSRDSMAEALEFLRQRMVNALTGDYTPVVIRAGEAPHRVEALIWRSPLSKWSISHLSSEMDIQYMEGRISGYDTREEAVSHCITMIPLHKSEAAKTQEDPK